MTKAEARAATNAIRTATARLWEMLIAVYEREGWRALGYGSWGAYFEAEFAMHRSRSYQLLDQARTVIALREATGDVSTAVDISERQARRLKPHLVVITDHVRAEVAAGVDPAQAVNNALELAYEVGHRDARAEIPAGPLAKSSGFTAFSSESSEWYSPQVVIDAALAVLGRIDVDPCAEPVARGRRHNIPALRHYTAKDDGLSKPWGSAAAPQTVYVNSPYGDEIPLWIEKLIAEHTAGRVSAAIALVPARTDTRWFQQLTDYPVCFVKGRLQFRVPKGRKLAGQSAPFPSAIFGLGVDRETFLRVFGEIGIVYYEPVTK